MKQIVFLLSLLTAGFLQAKEELMISLKFDNERILIRLAQNPSAREFYELLPLRLSFSDYALKEKIAPLNSRLKAHSSRGYSMRQTPKIGDLFYFKPWGNIGVFYEKQPYHSGLVKLGELVNLSDLAKIRAKNEDFVIIIEKF